ncbi:hypothetical protein SRABI128_01289 [Microbacterium sp. Bi128]|nr:hypothetical protein SRABI128_01289 [Microbacterium sp. Bi128]
MHGHRDDEHGRPSREVHEGRSQRALHPHAQPAVGALLPRDARAGDHRNDEHPQRDAADPHSRQADGHTGERQKRPDDSRDGDGHHSPGSVAEPVEQQTARRLPGDEPDREEGDTDCRDGEPLAGDGERPGRTAEHHPHGNRAVPQTGDEASEPGSPGRQHRREHDHDDQARAE